MDARSTVIGELEQNNASLLRELREVPDAKLTEVFAGTWSAREILVHVAAWYDMMGQSFERMGRGERPAPEGVNLSDSDAMNAQYVTAAEGKSISAVRKDLEVGLSRLERAARALPVDRFEEGKTALRILKGMADHPNEHIEGIRRWKAGA
jgi:hypothetical protein